MQYSGNTVAILHIVRNTSPTPDPPPRRYGSHDTTCVGVHHIKTGLL